MKTLFFVDDEPEILDGLRANLRRRRSEWTMQFFKSAGAALAALEKGSCDLIVSDLMMPGMDGGELLREVRRRRPATVRLALSGFADRDLSLRAATAAHQYIGKPCEPRELEAAIESCLEAQGLLGNETLRRTVLGLRGLPVSPQAYMRIRKLLEHEDPDPRAVAAAAETSVGVMVRLLQIVSSSFFALPRRVGSAREAIAYLGMDVVASVVLCAELFETGHEAAVPEEWLECIERHSLDVARLAAVWSDDPLRKERLFLAGLLHDAGRLAIAAGKSERRAGTEKEACGVDHARIGACLLAAWGLPCRLVDAVAGHHAPTPCAPGEESAEVIVHLADLLAHELEGRAVAAPGPELRAPLTKFREKVRLACEQGELVICG